jgi:hypothetical protein
MNTLLVVASEFLVIFFIVVMTVRHYNHKV